MIKKNERNKIIRFIEETVKNAGKTGVVLGLSGGIDSALVACLSAEALGTNNVFAISMPMGRYQTHELAIKQANLLEMHIWNAELDEALNVLCETFNNSQDNLRVGNIKARLRMITLYDYAAHGNCLVIGTENLTEHLLGYCTKWGDQASDFEPVINFLKTEIYQLAQHYLDSGQLLDEIYRRAPSADLWEGQTDETELGLTYEEIDAYLRHKQLLLDVPELAGQVYNHPDVKRKVEAQIASTQHKHNTPSFIRTD